MEDLADNGVYRPHFCMSQLKTSDSYKRGYSLGTASTTRKLLCLPEYLPNLLHLTFPVVARRWRWGTQVGTNPWNCKFIEIRFLVLSATSSYPLSFHFPDLSRAFWKKQEMGGIQKRGKSPSVH